MTEIFKMVLDSGVKNLNNRLDKLSKMWYNIIGGKDMTSWH